MDKQISGSESTDLSEYACGSLIHGVEQHPIHTLKMLAVSWHTEAEITDRYWPLPTSHSQWFKDVNGQNHNGLKEPQVLLCLQLALE